jgi:predicted TIM-barrel fold metal-dependent hydrolase
MDPRFSECEDVGVVAKRYPDIDFLVYHSGVELRLPEGPFDPGRAKGLDSLIVALQRNAIARDANVYADLGAVWKILMGEPEVAAHMIGKLLKHLGEDRVLWGTDSIWFGSPQDQIQAFRAFQIDDRLREQHGYPQLTPQARRKIFGLNGARVYGVDVPKARAMLDRDGLTKARAAYAERPLPSHRTYGPRTRRELLALWRSRGGAP